MRFTSTADLPHSEYLTRQEDVIEACEYFSRVPLLGFDTETDGLDFDGLGVRLLVTCIADRHRRVAIATYGEHRGNLAPLLKMLVETQSRHCNFNSIYDWNVIYGNTAYNGGSAVRLSTCWADGLKLFNLFDEEGEDTYGQRGLKARARHWVGLPMNDFDKIIQGGKLIEALETNPIRAQDYCTRDAWAHLGISALGADIAQRMPWCTRCTECGEYCFNVDYDRGIAQCVTHGWLPIGEELSMWHWHKELDIPFLHCLQKMQTRGMPIDWEYLQSTQEPLERARQNAYSKFLSEVTQSLSKRAGRQVVVDVNPNSASQLATLYHGNRDRHGNIIGFNLPVSDRTESGNPSMDKESLGRLWVRHKAPGIKELLEFSKIDKILSTYVIGFQERRFPATNRIHGKFRPDTKTSRLASADPNLQNLPARALHIIIPPSVPYVPLVQELIESWGCTEEEAQQELSLPMYQTEKMVVHIRRAVREVEGYTLICADYAQLEIRLTALDSECPDLIRVVNEGVDLHCYTAAKAFVAGLQGAEYDDIFEAKECSDDNFAPRLDTLRKVYTGEDDGLLARRTVGHAYDEEAFTQALDELYYLVSDTADNAELWGLVKKNAPDAWKVVHGVLGLRDKELLNFRKSAKSAIFGIIYGIGATKLAVDITEATGIVCPVEVAKKLIEDIKDNIFSGIGKMVRRQHRLVRERGYVRTAMGYYRHPAGVLSGDSGRIARLLRQASNSPIQGLAANVVQRAMIAIDQDELLYDLGAELLLQVHDELLVRCPEEVVSTALPRVQYLMETAHGLVTPVYLKVSAHAAYTWDEAK